MYSVAGRWCPQVLYVVRLQSFLLQCLLDLVSMILLTQYFDLFW